MAVDSLPRVSRRSTLELKQHMALPVGLEPTTQRLTAACSAN